MTGGLIVLKAGKFLLFLIVLIVLKAGKSGIMVPADWYLMRACFLIDGFILL